MNDRAGPYYDLARERSRLINTAWRTMGSPRRVSILIEGGEMRFFLRTKAGLIPATDQQREAWFAWSREKQRLYQELGWENKLHEKDSVRRPIPMDEGEDE